MTMEAAVVSGVWEDEVLLDDLFPEERGLDLLVLIVLVTMAVSVEEVVVGDLVRSMTVVVGGEVGTEVGEEEASVVAAVITMTMTVAED